jgi:hypothetical protein
VNMRFEAEEGNIIALYMWFYWYAKAESVNMI